MNYLDLPLEWREYYSKYPQGFSIWEALCDWTTKVNLMVDHLNLTQAQIDKLFTDTLPENIENVLNTWYADGTLSNIINLDFMNLKANKTELERLKASLGSVPYGEIKLPSDFPDVNFKLWRDQEGIHHNMKLDYYKSGSIVYVDSNAASEGDGTLALPFRTLTNAIFQCISGVSNKYLIKCKSERFNRGFSVQSSVIDGKLIAIVPDNAGNRIVLSNHYKNLVYAADGTLWKVTRSGVYSIYDLRDIDIHGMPIPFTRVTTLADCIATNKSYYTDDMDVWLHTNDGLAPDENNYVVNVSNSNFEPVIKNGGSLYIENALVLTGRNSPDNRPTGDLISGTASEFVALNCKFSGGNLVPGSLTKVNALSILDITKAYLINCIAAYGEEDGFNYHYTPMNRGTSLAVEINCLSYKNGVYSTTNTSNATTCHDEGKILRVNSIGYDAKGPVCADVEGTYSIFIDCNMKDSLAGGSGIKAAYQFYGTGSKAILINSGGGGEDTISIHASPEVEVTLQAFHGFNFAGGFEPIIK